MTEKKFYNYFCFFFLTLIIFQVFLKYYLYNCTFYDFGIIFKRQNFLEDKNYKDFFGGHVRFYEFLIQLIYNKISNSLIYFFLITLQIFIYVFTFLYIRKRDQFLSIIFLINPLVTNALFFDFHFEYIAVLFVTIFFYNSHKKYSIFFIMPIVFVSEVYAFLSVFLILIYFKNYKVNFIGIVFCIIIFFYVYFAIFYLFNWALSDLYLKYNLSDKKKFLYVVFSISFVLFFLKKTLYKNFISLNNNVFILLLNIIIIFFFIAVSFNLNNFNFININNHYLLIISFLSSIVIYNFFLVKNLKKKIIFLFFLFFLFFNPTLLGMQFYINKDSIFYYKNYINLYNLDSQKKISNFISSIDKNKNILINNNLCNLDAFNFKNISIYEDNYDVKKINYIIFTTHNYNLNKIKESKKFLKDNKVVYIEKNNNYIIATIK